MCAMKYDNFEITILLDVIFVEISRQCNDQSVIRMMTTTKNSQDYMLVIWLECLKGFNQCFYKNFSMIESSKGQ